MDLENNQKESSNIDNNQISLKELILVIKEWAAFLISKWKFIFIAGFIGSLIGLFMALSSKPTYKAVLTFVMEEDKGGGGGLGSALASNFGIDLGGGGGGAFSANNLTGLMKSRLIVEKVLLNPVKINGKYISLAEYYIEINGLRKIWEKNPALKSIQFIPYADKSNFTLQQDSILAQIHKSLIATDVLNILQREKKGTILSIEVTSGNEAFSKIFCENLAKETSDFYIETKSKKSRINVDLLQRQTDSVRNALNIAISGVANETDNVYNLNPAYNIKVAPSKKKQIDVQSNTALFTNLVVQLELAKITLRKETPLIQLIDSPILPLEKEKVSKRNSLVLGGILAGFLTILYFILSKLIKKLLS